MSDQSAPPRFPSHRRSAKRDPILSYSRRTPPTWFRPTWWPLGPSGSEVEPAPRCSRATDSTRSIEAGAESTGAYPQNRLADHRKNAIAAIAGVSQDANDCAQPAIVALPGLLRSELLREVEDSTATLDLGTQGEERGSGCSGDRLRSKCIREAGRGPVDRNPNPLEGSQALRQPLAGRRAAERFNLGQTTGVDHLDFEIQLRRAAKKRSKRIESQCHGRASLLGWSTCIRLCHPVGATAEKQHGPEERRQACGHQIGSEARLHHRKDYACPGPPITPCEHSACDS